MNINYTEVFCFITKECCGITLLFTYGLTMLAVTNNTASNGGIIST